MKLSIFSTLYLCSSVFLQSFAFADPVTLEELRLSALEKSSVAADVRADKSKTLAESHSIDSLSNPEIEVISAHPRGDTENDSSLKIEIKQPLRFGDLGARSRVAELLSQTANIEEKKKLLKLSQDVTIAYFTRWSLNETAKFLTQSQKDVNTARDIITRGVRDGIASPADKALFDGISAKVEADRHGVEALKLLSESNLLNITQAILSNVQFAPPRLPELPDENTFILAAHASDISPKAQAELSYQLKSAERSLVQYELGFGITPKIGYEQSQDGDTVEFGVEFPLPLWNSNRGLRDSSAASEASSRVQKDFIDSEKYSIILRNLLTRAKLIEKQKSAYEKRVIPSFAEGVQLELARLTTGQGSVGAVWESNRQLLEARLKWIDLTKEALLARLELESMTGQPYAF